eukprot:2646127-Pyramimonas_sp.AAC.1
MARLETSQTRGFPGRCTFVPGSLDPRRRAARAHHLPSLGRPADVQLPWRYQVRLRAGADAHDGQTSGYKDRPPTARPRRRGQDACEVVHRAPACTWAGY